jgi:hypothetical protein
MVEVLPAERIQAKEIVNDGEAHSREVEMSIRYSLMPSLLLLCGCAGTDAIDPESKNYR